MSAAGSVVIAVIVIVVAYLTELVIRHVLAPIADHTDPPEDADV